MNQNTYFLNQQQIHLNPINLAMGTSPILNFCPQLKQQQEIRDYQQKISEEDSKVQGSISQQKKQWTPEQDQLVYSLHNQYGNKWAIIAARLKGRSDNCIKNHFYSRLRKGLRKVNKMIEDHFKPQYKQFKTIDLYKVIEASDQKFKQVNSFPTEMTQVGHNLKNRLFIFAEQQSDGTEEFNVKAKKLLFDLTEFTKNYKRKSKKCRRYSPMGVGSIYRNNSKKAQVTVESQQPEIQKPQNIVTSKQQEKVVLPSQKVKSEQTYIDKNQKRSNLQRKQPPKTLQPIKQSTNSQHKEIPVQIQEVNIMRSKSKNKEYHKFSDDEDQEKHETEYLKEQRLNHFAQNILKTFKSYYSFKSFKSNSVFEEPFFQ